jgi:preprotein translocase subunit SecE
VGNAVFGGGVLSLTCDTKEAVVAKAEKGKITERRQPNRIQVFFRETVGELRKVSWPTRQEAWNLTLIVLAVVFSMGTLLGLLDFLFTRFFAIILG